MSDTELGVNYHLRESGSGTESELGLTIGLCVKFKPLAQGNPFLLVTTIPPWLLHLYLNGIVTQTHVKCRLRCQNSQKKKKKQLRMQTSWNPKDVHSISEFSVFPFPFAFLVLGRRKCPCLLIEGVFHFGWDLFCLYFFFSFVCLCLYTFAIEAIRRLGIYSSWCGLSILISEQYEIFISLFGKHVFPTNSWPTFWPQT